MLINSYTWQCFCTVCATSGCNCHTAASTAGSDDVMFPAVQLVGSLGRNSSLEVVRVPTVSADTFGTGRNSAKADWKLESAASTRVIQRGWHGLDTSAMVKTALVPRAAPSAPLWTGWQGLEVWIVVLSAALRRRRPLGERPSPVAPDLWNTERQYWFILFICLFIHLFLSFDRSFVPSSLRPLVHWFNLSI